MCGICVYIGHDNSASGRVFEGLKKLEYRGYDSWGMAVFSGNRVKVIKRVGKIHDFSERKNLPKGKITLGHTRWATQGIVSEKNAHPHFSCRGRFVIVHNGIVENYQDLKRKLTAAGIGSVSETDTEVIVNLLEYEMTKKQNMVDALISVTQIIQGRNAFVIFDRVEKTVWAVKGGSPLLLGIGNDGIYVASDFSPFLAETKRAVFFENNELAQVLPGGFRFFSAVDGQQIKKEITFLDYSEEEITKQGFPHFFIKEVKEQPGALLTSLKSNLGNIDRAAELVNNAERIFLCGAGTAGRVAVLGSQLLSRIAGCFSTAFVASEFATYLPFFNQKSLLITISQSGETADTLEAVEQAKRKGAQILSIVNAAGSSLMRESDWSFPMNAGIEKAVASTKATTTPIALLTLLAFNMAGQKEKGEVLIKKISFRLAKFLDSDEIEKIKLLAKKIKLQENIYIIGRGISYPTALECAIKLQELACVHAEGIAGAELKHYALSLIQKYVPTIVLVPNDETKAAILGNAAEIKLRGGRIIGIAPENNFLFEEFVKVTDLGEFGSPILNLVPVQLLAYYLTLERGFDPDYCRNLAKSVTVK